MGTGAGPAPVIIRSPAEANTKVFAAAMASGSFHYQSVSSGTSGGASGTETESGDAGRGEGVQFMTSAFGDSEVIVVDSMAYMRGNATMLENMFGYTLGEAAPFVSRWIAFSPSDSLYRAVAADVTVDSLWGDPSLSPPDQLPQNPESVSGLSTVSGSPSQSVRYVLHGTNEAAKASYSGTETIVFSTNDPHLPSLLTEHLSTTSTQGASTDTTRVTFSHWGEPVTVSAPAATIPFSALPAPTSTV